MDDTIRPIDVPERVLAVSGATTSEDIARLVLKLLSENRIQAFFNAAVFKFPRGVRPTSQVRQMISLAVYELENVYVGQSLWRFPYRGSEPTRAKNEYMSADFLARAVAEAQTLGFTLGADRSWLDFEMATTKPEHITEGHGPQREELWGMSPARRGIVKAKCETIAASAHFGQVDLAYCDHGAKDFAEPFRPLAKRHWSPDTYKLRTPDDRIVTDNRKVWCSWVSAPDPSAHRGSAKPLSSVEAYNLRLPAETELYGVYTTKREIEAVVEELARLAEADGA